MKLRPFCNILYVLNRFHSLFLGPLLRYIPFENLQFKVVNMCVKPYTLFIRLRKPRVWVEKHDILREMTLFPRNSVFLIVMRSSQTLFLQRKSNILVKSQEYIEVARNLKRCHLKHVFYFYNILQLKCPALPVVFQKPFFFAYCRPQGTSKMFCQFGPAV